MKGKAESTHPFTWLPPSLKDLESQGLLSFSTTGPQRRGVNIAWEKVTLPNTVSASTKGVVFLLFKS